jgi:hypothetical protein
MRQSMDALTNLAFLYILAGGMLPHHNGLFDSVTQNIEDVTGESVDALTGTGVEEMAFATDDFADADYGGVDDFDGDTAQLDDYDGQNFGGDALDSNDVFGVSYGERRIGDQDDLAAYLGHGDGVFADSSQFGDIGVADKSIAFRYGDNAEGCDGDADDADCGDCGDGVGQVDCGDCDVEDILNSLASIIFED